MADRKVVAAFAGPDTSIYQGMPIVVLDNGEWLSWNWSRRAWEQFIPPISDENTGHLPSR